MRVALTIFERAIFCGLGAGAMAIYCKWHEHVQQRKWWRKWPGPDRQ